MIYRFRGLIHEGKLKRESHGSAPVSRTTFGGELPVFGSLHSFKYITRTACNFGLVWSSQLLTAPPWGTVPRKGRQPGLPPGRSFVTECRFSGPIGRDSDGQGRRRTIDLHHRRTHSNIGPVNPVESVPNLTRIFLGPSQTSDANLTRLYANGLT